MGRPGVWASLGLTAFLTGCSTVYSMSLSGDLERPTASFRQAGKPVYLCLSSLEVRDRSDGTPVGRLVWEIRAEADCMTLGSISYGELPTGFTLVHAAEPLRRGVIYEAFGMGVTTGFFGVSAAGGGQFAYHDGGWWQPSGSVR